jgi:hypothetical protein
MRRVASLVACCVILLAGCRHTTPEQRMNKLLYQSEKSGPPDNSKQQPTDSHLTPDRIHCGII